jgi:hypothetical protein
MAYSWLYTSWNDNEYILFLIIVILFFIIVDFKLFTRKRSNFFNLPDDNVTGTPSTTSISGITMPNTTVSITSTIPSTTIPGITTSRTTITNTTIPNTTIPNTTIPNTTIPNITKPITTSYKPPVVTKPGDNLFVSNEEKEKWRRAWVQLDGNEEALYLSNTAISNDILQFDSTLYAPTDTSNILANLVDYSKKANWATIDDLGKSMTDTLGGINSNLGYTLLQEQLGTFKTSSQNTYDNNQNYKTGMNPSTVSGAGGNYQQVGKSPVFMQKDFAGVANIFAPNIYVSNAPLNDDGFPDISLTNGDGTTYSV